MWFTWGDNDSTGQPCQESARIRRVTMPSIDEQHLSSPLAQRTFTLAMVASFSAWVTGLEPWGADGSIFKPSLSIHITKDGENHPESHFLEQPGQTEVKATNTASLALDNQTDGKSDLFLCFSNVKRMRRPVYACAGRRAVQVYFGGDSIKWALRGTSLWCAECTSHLRGQRKGRTRTRLCELPAHRAKSELYMTAGHSDVNLNIIVKKGIHRHQRTVQLVYWDSGGGMLYSREWSGSHAICTFYFLNQV